MGQFIVTTRKQDSLEKAKSEAFSMGIGAELCVVSKRNQLIRSKDEQGGISEEKKYLIPALRQATRGVWGTCRNNIAYAQSYLRPFLTLLLQDAVKISALSSEKTPSNLKCHLWVPRALSKLYPCLISLISDGSPRCFPMCM